MSRYYVDMLINILKENGVREFRTDKAIDILKETDVNIDGRCKRRRRFIPTNKELRMQLKVDERIKQLRKDKYGWWWIYGCDE